MEKKKSKTYYLMLKAQKGLKAKQTYYRFKPESKTIGMGFWLKSKGLQKKIKGLK
jgi:hypothetical protein